MSWWRVVKHRTATCFSNFCEDILQTNNWVFVEKATSSHEKLKKKHLKRGNKLRVIVIFNIHIISLPTLADSGLSKPLSLFETQAHVCLKWKCACTWVRVMDLQLWTYCLKPTADHRSILFSLPHKYIKNLRKCYLTIYLLQFPIV